MLQVYAGGIILKWNYCTGNESRSGCVNRKNVQMIQISSGKKITFLLLVWMLAGCVKTQNKTCIRYETAPVYRVDGPDSGAVNEDIAFSVHFTCANGCGKYHHTDEMPLGDTTLVIMTAKYEGCLCTDIVQYDSATYIFRADVPGTYYLKFEQVGANFLTDTLTIY